mmetsp:Transcript_87191/g.247214  ORF Transcript_87191/g.247214 Transcript_87191/m.247214 type:complete len:290 (-) Transcript_87191:815-1684(-)
MRPRCGHERLESLTRCGAHALPVQVPEDSQMPARESNGSHCSLPRLNGELAGAFGIQHAPRHSRILPQSAPHKSHKYSEGKFNLLPDLLQSCPFAERDFVRFSRVQKSEDGLDLLCLAGALKAPNANPADASLEAFRCNGAASAGDVSKCRMHTAGLRAKAVRKIHGFLRGLRGYHAPADSVLRGCAARPQAVHLQQLLAHLQLAVRQRAHIGALEYSLGGHLVGGQPGQPLGLASHPDAGVPQVAQPLAALKGHQQTCSKPLLMNPQIQLHLVHLWLDEGEEADTAQP